MRNASTASAVSTVTISPLYLTLLAQEAQQGAQKLADVSNVGTSAAELRSKVEQFSRLEEIARLAHLEPKGSNITLTYPQMDDLVSFAREIRPKDQRSFSPSISRN